MWRKVWVQVSKAFLFEELRFYNHQRNRDNTINSFYEYHYIQFNDIQVLSLYVYNFVFKQVIAFILLIMDVVWGLFKTLLFSQFIDFLFDLPIIKDVKYINLV